MINIRISDDYEVSVIADTREKAHEDHRKIAGIEGFFITPDELTQIKKEAFEAGQGSMGVDGFDRLKMYSTFNDYLKEHIK